MAFQFSTRDSVSSPSEQHYQTLFERFSGAANKSSGRSHPADEARWLKFIRAAHRSGEPPSRSEVYEWLVARDWDVDTARELSNEYEFGIELLNVP